MARAKDYAGKRSFDTTPEPPPETGGNVDPATAPPGITFVIHQHHARRLHFDLRLEMLNGKTPVLVSWAVPKNLPLNPGKVHLAVHVEDHPFEYGSFSGTIPPGEYGAGEVRIFDKGDYEVLEQEDGKLTIRLHGARMKGVWHLFRTRSENGSDDWLVRLRTLERENPEPLPDLSPMLATLVADPFDDDDWLFEPKWDGIRAIATCTPEQTLLLSRTKRDITTTYPELAGLHHRMVAIEAVVDGEIVSMAQGRPSFEQLQARMNLQNPHEVKQMAKQAPVTFIAYDLLYLDGKSIVDRPLHERKGLLEDLVVPDDRTLVSPVTPGEGIALFDAAQGANLEGIVAKRRDCPYQPGKRSRDWLKIKTTFQADVVIGGWSRGEGARAGTFGSLIVGAYSDEGLRYVGSVGTGFTDKKLREMMSLLEECESDECPFVEGPKALRSGRWGKPLKDPHWMLPCLVAVVEYRELTSTGKLRAPSFKTFRTDKAPEECRFEALTPPGRSGDQADTDVAIQ